MKRYEGTVQQGNDMVENKIPKVNSHEKMAKFSDTHCLADYWDQTASVESEVSKKLHHRYLVSVDQDILKHIQQVAVPVG
jgi:hypothetical protein